MNYRIAFTWTIRELYNVVSHMFDLRLTHCTFISEWLKIMNSNLITMTIDQQKWLKPKIAINRHQMKEATPSIYI